MDEALALIRRDAPDAAVPLARPAIRFQLDAYEPEHPPVGASRVGGRPDWPADKPWPRWRDTCMDFIAQIDLSTIRRMKGAQDLPPTGWLWFFYSAYAETLGLDASEAGSWAVVWGDPPRDSLVPAWMPPDFDLDASYPAFTLRAAGEWTMPSANVRAVEALGLGRDDEVSYEQMERRLSTLNGDDGGAIRLLGYPALFQNVDPETGAEAIAPGGGADWRLLFQLTPPDHWGVDFILDFLIRDEDLKARRFERAWLYRDA